MPRESTTGPQAISPWLFAAFHGIAQRRVARAFRALRIANAQRVPATQDSSFVVCLNHPSWWDPLVGFILSRRLFPGRQFYAPMDAEALKRYGLFRRLGMFPVEMHSARGAAQFLRNGAAVLDAGNLLAVTPQGHFTDVRARPVQMRPGLAALLHRRAAQGGVVTVLPLALEYTFWDQRLPEALVNCGVPLRFGKEQHAGGDGVPSQAAMHAALEQAMGRAQDELAALSLLRDPHRFASVLEGRRGSAGFYGWIERSRALLGGGLPRGDHQHGDHLAPANTNTTVRKR